MNQFSNLSLGEIYGRVAKGERLFIHSGKTDESGEIDWTGFWRSDPKGGFIFGLEDDVITTKTKLSFEKEWRTIGVYQLRKDTNYFYDQTDESRMVCVLSFA